jgi:hypothetical protein
VAADRADAAAKLFMIRCLWSKRFAVVSISAGYPIPWAVISPTPSARQAALSRKLNARLGSGFGAPYGAGGSILANGFFNSQCL